MCSSDLTVEHLLLMILNDFDVIDFFKTKEINIESLKDNINDHLKNNIVPKVDQQKPVQPTLGFQRVLQRSVFHIQSSGKGVVKPINILVAIFSEKESHSVFLLNKYKLTRLDVVTYLSHLFWISNGLLTKVFFNFCRKYLQTMSA